MSVQDLGALGEFFASIAVLITLIALTVQMRQTKIALRRSSFRQCASDHAKAVDGVRHDAEIFIRGTEDLDSLNPVDRFRFDLAMFNWLQAVEQAFADFRAGYVDDDSLTLFRNNIPGVLSSPGGLIWWNQRKAWFSHQFRSDVGELLANPPEESAAAGVAPLT